jgi:hypothetical protein
LRCGMRRQQERGNEKQASEGGKNCAKNKFHVDDGCPAYENRNGCRTFFSADKILWAAGGSVNRFRGACA